MMNTIHSNRFDLKSFLRAMAAIAIPVALQNLLTTTGSMVDTIMIASLGSNTVGAIGLCAQFSSLMFSCYWGFVGGGMLFFGQYWGAKDDDGIDRSFGMTLMCMMFVGVAFNLFAVLGADKVMQLYTDKISLQEIGIPYLQIVGFAYPLQVYTVCMGSVLRSTEKVKIPLIASIASVCTNIVMNYCLISGHFGFPALGVRGAALATLIANAVNVIVTLILAKKAGYPYLFHFRKHFQWTVSETKKYLKKCFPIICNELFIGIGNMVINIVLGRQSEDAIAAIAVFRTLEGLVISFFGGFSSASSVLVGKCVGSGELDTAYERAKRLVYACGVCILMVCLLLFTFHTPILHSLSLQGDAFKIGTEMLAVYCVIAVIRMMNWAQNDTYRAAGDAVFGTIMEIVFMYIAVIPAVYLTGMKWGSPFLVVFACSYIDEPIRFVFMQSHLFSGRWIKPVTEQGLAVLPAFREKHARKKRTA